MEAVVGIARLPGLPQDAASETDFALESKGMLVSRRAIAQCMLYLAGLIHLRQKDYAMADEKTEQFQSDRLVLPSKRELNLRDLANKGTGLPPEGKKLPPEPGRTPRASSVPSGEVLPREKD
jgi:hypothetical protein